MGNLNNQGYVKLAVALVMSLLMAPSTAVAESEHLKSNYLSARYLGYNVKELRYPSEVDPLSGYEINRAQPASKESRQISIKELWAQSEGESVSGSETDSAQQADANDVTGGMSIRELSQQSANPVSVNAYVFTQFATTFSDGDLNTGGDHAAGSITFQPIIPIPLYGQEENEWRIVTRPTINLFLQQPVYEGKGETDNFHRETDISDLLVPLPLALPDKLSGNWLLAAGPSFSFPTATEENFGHDNWCVGASGVFGYIAKNWMVGMYPQTYFKYASQDDDKDDKGARFGNMFYWFFYNITDEWQIGTNPTIQWNDKATSDNKWNVPVGLTISKITQWGKTPMRLEFGVEYSVVSEDDYGEVARIKLNIIPVVARPIKKSIFGGK